MRFFLPIFAKGLFLVCFCIGPIRADETALEKRKSALLQLDEWLDALTPNGLKTFPLSSKEPSYTHADPPIELSAFAVEYGFFSDTRPLIGKVTEDVADIAPIQKALKAVMQSPSAFFIELATAEILSKALAYRNLKKGMKIEIPCIDKKQVCLVTYIVDEVIDLWQEMPAFGMVPEDKKHVPILLFRGTDLSLDSKKSWASLLSDLDLSGSGLSTFHFAKADIHAWLVKAFSYGGKKAKAMGFSLGGILALYTTVFEADLIAAAGSIAFNPPGVSSPIARKWASKAPAHIIYITQGDVIPKLGVQPSPTFLLFGKSLLPPIKAHTQLMTAEPVFFLDQIAEKSNSK